MFDWLNNLANSVTDGITGLFSGGGAGGNVPAVPNAPSTSSWLDIVSPVLQGGLTAFSGYQNGQNVLADSQATREFNAQQAQLERESAMQRLQMQLAAQKSGSGAANAIAMKQLQQRAAEAAIQAILQGDQGKQQAIQTLISGVRSPFNLK